MKYYLKEITHSWQRLQAGSTYTRGGKGRKRKLKSLDDYSMAEKRYVDYKSHVYSRRLIDLCVKHQAGTLLLVNQERKRKWLKGKNFYCATGATTG